jgi:hypothetical protein
MENASTHHVWSLQYKEGKTHFKSEQNFKMEQKKSRMKLTKKIKKGNNKSRTKLKLNAFINLNEISKIEQNI